VTDVTISAAQNGRVVPVRVGDSITLRLPENAATGYRWTFASLDESKVTLEADGHEGSATGVGSGGEATWTLRARTAGPTRIALKRWRHWEGDRSIIDRFDVALEIGPPRPS